MSDEIGYIYWMVFGKIVWQNYGFCSLHLFENVDVDKY